jgi:hypothetical protein
MGAIDDDRCSAGTVTAGPSVAIRVHGLPPPEVFTYNSDHKELCYDQKMVRCKMANMQQKWLAYNIT